MRIASFFISLFLTLFIFSCTTTEPPDKEDPPDPVVIPSLGLAEDDAHCTEAWLKLTSEDIEFPAELILRQYNPSGDSLSFQFSLTTDDTLFYIDSLLPGQGYSFMVWFTATDSLHPPSNKLSVTTMDTTSHDFTFDMLTFGGETGSSSLHDVAIINENNIWAVGEIFIEDTSSLGYKKYNAVHWDGNSWSLEQIYFRGECSLVEYPLLKSIWAIDSENILITNGGAIGWFDGHTVSLDCGMNSLLNGAVNEIWASDEDNIYLVGNDGAIVHYDGSLWQKIESGTELNINDIWGDYNGKTGEWEILAVASNFGSSSQKEILSIKGMVVNKITPASYMESLLTSWFISDRCYYVAGSGIYKRDFFQKDLWPDIAKEITIYSTTCIRGNALNDIICVGAYGDFLHYNGISWKNEYTEVSLENGSYSEIKIFDDILVAVGYNYLSAIILTGTRSMKDFSAR